MMMNDKVIMVIVMIEMSLKLKVMMMMRERQVSKCMYLTICSCLPPRLAAIPPSSAPQLTLTLILGSDDSDDDDNLIETML